MLTHRKIAGVRAVTFRSRAFTLIEVMVAVLVFSIGVLSTLSLLIQQTRIVRRNQERIYITRILESRLEEVRDLTFTELETLQSENPSGLTFSVHPAVDVLGRAINPNIVEEDELILAQ